MYSEISPLVQLTCVECSSTLLLVGKELQQIASELIEEFKELTKLPSINFAIQKSKELYAKVSYNNGIKIYVLAAVFLESQIIT
jgi:hypothetical protein